ncbi:hypothetical protein B1VFA_142 [Rhizobium phage B1VFA]|nr:hypothetical protein B1VFA_142 [Rhizobium phage B1VFA]
MEIFSLQIPADVYLGSPESYVRYDQEITNYIAADSLAAAQQIVSEFHGEMMSLSFGFDRAISLSQKLEETYQKKQETQAYQTPEEKHIEYLLQKASWDLGSIVIDRAFFLVSNKDRLLKGARIEAHDGDRRRVVYIEELNVRLDTILPHQIIQPLEAKF